MDEFQHAPALYDKYLPRIRKHHGSYVCIAQGIAQVDAMQEGLHQTVFNNAATHVFFRTRDYHDADYLAHVLDGEKLTYRDLQLLGLRQCYVATTDGARPLDPVLVTLPLPLRAALDRLGLMAPRPTPSAVGRTAARTTTLTGPDDLRGRVAAVRATPTAMPSRADLLTLPLALPPRAWPLLLHVGQHPLLDRHEVAAVWGGDPHDTWEVLRALCRHGLCQAWRPNASGHGRAWRYSLTTRGTVLLAHGTGLSPRAYRRIHGVLDDARRAGERGLAYARGNLAHTDGITAAFLAFLAAARARGGALIWRGEWACARPYLRSTTRRSYRCCSGRAARGVPAHRASGRRASPPTGARG